MKALLILILGTMIFASPLARAESTLAPYSEPWKGHTQTSPVEFGAMSGMTIYGSTTNWSFLLDGAYLIKPEGWITDIDNRVWGEIQVGPAFFSTGIQGQTGVQYSAHLRWDFTLDENWTFYGLGGLGGFLTPSLYGNSFTLHPRFGVGTEFQTKVALMFRAELSAEFVGGGIAFNF